MPKGTYHHQGENLPSQGHNDEHVLTEQENSLYWKANLSLLAKLLTIWFGISFGCGILLADWLDQFSFFGFKLGFWFAQQGAIYGFVALIFVYSWRMKVLERQFGVDDEEWGS